MPPDEPLIGELRSVPASKDANGAHLTAAASSAVPLSVGAIDDWANGDASAWVNLRAVGDASARSHRQTDGLARHQTSPAAVGGVTQHPFRTKPDTSTEAELADLRARLDTLPVIEQAKGVVMAEYEIDADTAFLALRRWSSHTNLKLRVISAILVNAVGAQPEATAGSNPADTPPAPRPVAPSGAPAGPSLDAVLHWLNTASAANRAHATSPRRPTPSTRAASTRQAHAAVSPTSPSPAVPSQTVLSGELMDHLADLLVSAPDAESRAAMVAEVVNELSALVRWAQPVHEPDTAELAGIGGITAAAEAHLRRIRSRPDQLPDGTRS